MNGENLPEAYHLFRSYCPSLHMFIQHEHVQICVRTHTEWLNRRALSVPASRAPKSTKPVLRSRKVSFSSKHATKCIFCELVLTCFTFSPTEPTKHSWRINLWSTIGLIIHVCNLFCINKKAFYDLVKAVVLEAMCRDKPGGRHHPKS